MTRYNGRFRDLHQSRDGVVPVVRFLDPPTGKVVVDDRVHGRVDFRNEEPDDLIITRPDGTPTYCFMVIVDDHLNNSTRQIKMLKVLGAEKSAMTPQGDRRRLGWQWVFGNALRPSCRSRSPAAIASKVLLKAMQWRSGSTGERSSSNRCAAYAKRLPISMS